MVDTDVDAWMLQHFKISKEINLLEEEDEMLRYQIRRALIEGKMEKHSDALGNIARMTSRVVENIDKKKLIADFGEEKIKPYINIKQSTFLQLMSAEQINNYKKMGGVKNGNI